MTTPLVSVCIPTYNGALHLAECLDSVCAQTYSRLDILVVDDASSDESLGIIERYQRADKRVRLVRNERNLGLVGNWSRSIGLARGEYIKFAFQDDVLYPACVEALVQAVGQEIRFAFCAREFIFGEGTDPEHANAIERNRKMIADAFSESPIIKPEVYCQAVLDKIPNNLVGEPTVTLVHRDVFTRYGDFNADMVQLVDFEFWCRVAANETVGYVPSVLAKFRFHAASETSRNEASKLFRARQLDRLLLLHEFAFSPHFRSLREAASRRRPVMDMAEIFYEEAHWTAAIAREKAEALHKPDRSELDELKALAARYPALLGPAPVSYMLARKWKGLRRKLHLGT